MGHCPANEPEGLLLSSQPLGRGREFWEEKPDNEPKSDNNDTLKEEQTLPPRDAVDIADMRESKGQHAAECSTAIAHYVYVG